MYTCILINESGCCFDNIQTLSKKYARTWAQGRGTTVRYHAELYSAENELIDYWIPRG
jgi:hypothetical protein